MKFLNCIELLKCLCSAGTPHAYNSLSETYLRLWTTRPVVGRRSIHRLLWLLVDHRLYMFSTQGVIWFECRWARTVVGYDKEITSILHHIIPFRTVQWRRRPSEPSHPWFDTDIECRVTKRRVRYFERAVGRVALNYMTRWLMLRLLPGLLNSRVEYKSVLKLKRESVGRCRLTNSDHTSVSVLVAMTSHCCSWSRPWSTNSPSAWVSLMFSAFVFTSCSGRTSITVLSGSSPQLA